MKTIGNLVKNSAISLTFAAVTGFNTYFLATEPTINPKATKVAMILGLGLSGKYYYNALKSYLKAKQEQEAQK